jgi:endonuclease YncB( thermonuclease family)
MFIRAKSFFRPLPTLVLGLLLLPLLAAPACAAEQEQDMIVGVPFVQENGLLTINGQKIALWGIDMLAPDQQCWQGDMSWCCGEHAMSALKHYVENRTVECVIRRKAVEGAPALAQCFRLKGPNRQDIARHLILRGWTVERPQISGGYYFEDEQKAQTGKYGIWSSRFQTAQDWKEGIQRFVGEEADESLSTPVPDSVSSPDLLGSE